MTIPTLTTVTEAETLLRELAETSEWVSVFWDKRDRRTPEIDIITDGDGQKPKAHITESVYVALIELHVVGEDTYAGFHNRRIHDFKTPPVPEKTGPTPNEVIEEVLRALFAEHQDLPLKTAFFRGINKGNTWNPINEEVLVTDAYDRDGYANISPGAAEAYISAWTKPGLFGDRIGDGVTVFFPRSAENDPDVEAMREPAFREELLAAIRSQLALLPSETS